MRGYSRVDEDLDQYETDELDEYEDIEGDEYGEAEDEEEDPTPKKEVQDYLVLRQKLKEEARKKLARQSGSGSNARDSKRSKLENFGSFFGPSRPVIAERVIQESKSFLETRQEIPRISSSQKDSRKGQTSGTSAPPRNGMTERRPHNPVKTKVQKLKDTRDYSFLLSDDADVPRAAANVPPSRGSSVSAQVPSKSKESSRPSSNGTGERRPGVANSHIRPGQSGQKLVHQKPLPSTRPDPIRAEHKKHYPVSGHGNGTGRLAMPKEVPSRKESHMTKRFPSHLERKVSGASTERKAPAAAIVKKPSTAAAKVPMSNGQRPQLLKPRQLEERSIDRSKGKYLPKQPSSSFKPQMKAPKQIPPRYSREDDSYWSKPKSQLQKPQPQTKPKPFKRSSGREDQSYSLEIRKMFGYHPNNYSSDDDTSNMEADFRTIQMEEKRSSKIAKEEDAKELIKIQEEEERERRRKLAKRKMGQR